MIQKYLIKALAWLVAIVAIVGLLLAYRAERANRIRLERNQGTLLDEGHYWQDSAHKNIATIGLLNLTLQELKGAHEAQVVRMRGEIERLGLKLRQVQEVTNATTENQLAVSGVLRDTVIIERGDTMAAKAYRVRTEFNEVAITYYPRTDSIKATVTTWDEMTQVVYKERRGGKFWRREWWQSRELRQVITFRNPNTVIKYPRTIRVQGR